MFEVVGRSFKRFNQIYFRICKHFSNSVSKRKLQSNATSSEIHERTYTLMFTYAVSKQFKQSFFFRSCIYISVLTLFSYVLTHNNVKFVADTAERRFYGRQRVEFCTLTDTPGVYNNEIGIRIVRESKKRKKR